MRWLSALILLSSFAFSQTAKPKRDPYAKLDGPSVAIYAHRAYRGFQKMRIFTDDPRNDSFTLVTSWIPGQDRQGAFRYQLSAEILPPSLSDVILYNATPPPKGWNVPESIDRLH